MSQFSSLVSAIFSGLLLSYVGAICIQSSSKLYVAKKIRCQRMVTMHDDYDNDDDTVGVNIKF